MILILTVLFDLFVTILIYGLGPILLLAFRQKPISPQKLKAFHIVYTCIIALGCKILLSLANEELGSFSAALIWGFIFYRLNLSQLKKRNMIVEQRLATPPPSVCNNPEPQPVTFANEPNIPIIVAQNPVSHPPKAKNTRSFKRCLLAIIFVIFTISPLLAIYFSKDDSSKIDQPSQSSISQSPTLYAQPTPKNGEILYKRVSTENSIAPFSVETREGKNYYVKLRHLHSQKDEVAFFVEGGKTAEIEVPLGTYELLYACGSTWYGKTDLFGSDTYYAKANETFQFYEEDSYVNGWTVELYLQSNGNLSTEKISPEEF